MFMPFYSCLFHPYFFDHQMFGPIFWKQNNFFQYLYTLPMIYNTFLFISTSYHFTIKLVLPLVWSNLLWLFRLLTNKMDRFMVPYFESKITCFQYFCTLPRIPISYHVTIKLVVPMVWSCLIVELYYFQGVNHKPVIEHESDYYFFVIKHAFVFNGMKVNKVLMGLIIN